MAAVPLRVLCGVTLLLLVGCRVSRHAPAASEPTTRASVGGSTSSASASAGSVSSPTSTPISASSAAATTPLVPSATPSPLTPLAVAPSSASPSAGHATPRSRGKSATPSPDGNPLVDEIWGNNAVPFRPPTSAEYLHTPLGQQSFGGQAASLVPAGWKYVNATIPSNHNDLIWYDPKNPAARIEFTGTGCEVCVEENIYATNPVRDVVHGLPFDTTSYDLYNHGLDAGFRETDADGYAVNGAVALIGTDADPNGYAIYRVSLPANDTPLATRILNSFTGFGQGT